MSEEFNSQAVHEHQRELRDGIQERAITRTPGGKSYKGTATAGPEELRAAAIRVVQKLQDDGHDAYFAGGCVRDQLLGKSPKDYDIATSARPRRIRRLFDNAGFVGAHFGVVLVREPEGPFEIATFRADGLYLDGRRPKEVRFANAEEDAYRRDFTVNGLFLDPIKNQLIDWVQGREDLEKRILRAIGDPIARFREDHLRMMRAVRFATTVGFQIDPATLAALKGEASSIGRISIERVRDELVQILEHPNRVQGFDILVGTGLMGEILPEILELMGCEQPPDHHPEGDVFVHTRLMLSKLPENASLSLVLSVLFHDIAKPATYTWDEAAGRIRFPGHAEAGADMAEKILRRFKFSNQVIENTVAAVARHMDFLEVGQMKTSTLKRLMALPIYNDLLELHHVDCLGGSGNLEHYEFMLAKANEFSHEPLIPPPLVSGRDLIEQGWDSGPELGDVLDAIQTEQLDGHLTTRDEAITWARSQVTAA